jgi:hypothetical protein
MCLIGHSGLFWAPPFFVRGCVRSIKLPDYDLLTTNIYYYDPTVILCFSAPR